MIDLKINWWRIAGWFALIIGVLFLAFCIGGGLKSCSEQKLTPNIPVVINPALQGTFEAEQRIDTIKIPFLQKIYIKEVVPEYIQVVKVDSAFRETVKNWDVMTKVDKKGRILKIYTYNENDSLLKYSEYEVSNDFTATSANDRLVVRHKLFGYSGVSFTAEYLNNIAWNNQRAYLGFETGFNFDERIYFTVNPKYNLFGNGSLLENTDISAKLSLRF